MDLDDILRTLIKLFGSIIIGVLWLAIPILTALSFVYEWHGFLKVILTLFSILEMLTMVLLIYFKNDD